MSERRQRSRRRSSPAPRLPAMALCLLVVFMLVFSLKAIADEKGIIIVGSEGCPAEGAPPQCAIDGEPDLYGFGVRFGVYFIWIASWLANNFVIDEYDGALDSNSIFLLAIGIAVALNSSNSEVRLIDSLILVQLGLGFIFGVMSVWGYRTAVYRREGAVGADRFGGLGTHVRLFLLAGLTAFNTYFWSVGISSGFPPCNRREACNGIRVFFLGSQSLFSGARTFYLVIAGFCCVHYLLLCFACLAWLARTFVDRIRGRDPAWSLQRQRMHYECLTLKE